MRGIDQVVINHYVDHVPKFLDSLTAQGKKEENLLDFTFFFLRIISACNSFISYELIYKHTQSNLKSIIYIYIGEYTNKKYRYIYVGEYRKTQ